jgi:hypothetical protein
MGHGLTKLPHKWHSRFPPAAEESAKLLAPPLCARRRHSNDGNDGLVDYL